MMPQDLPITCFRCATADQATDGPIDGLCRACRGEVAANRAGARDELARWAIDVSVPPQPNYCVEDGPTVTRYTAHTRALADYPADIRFGAL